jgi:raffinose/stachyose/melibiose transport system substrate-binding protein
MKRFLVFGMLLVLCGTALFAGGQSSGGQSSGSQQKVKLRLLMPANEDIRQDISKNYIAPALAKEYPDWEIEIENDAGDKLMTYNASGDMPDVFYADGMSATQPILETGHNENLLPYITTDGFADKYKVKSVIAPWTDGKLYNLDPGTDSYYAARLFIRKSMFAENNIPIPKTYAEFVSACKAFVAKGIVPLTAIQPGDMAIRLILLQTLVMAENPQAITDFYNGKTGFTDPNFISALGKVEELYKLGAFPPDFTTGDYGSAINQFTSKQIPMFFFFTWTMSSFENDPDVDIIPFPQVSPDVDMTQYLQIWGGPLKGYGVSSKSKFKDAAVKAAEICAMQDAIYFNTVQKVMSALDTGVQITGLSALARKNLDLFNAAPNKMPSLSLIWGPKVDTEIAIQFSALLTGQTSARAVLETVEKIRLGN